PLKFESVEVLQVMIDEYFEKCDDDEIPYTITGLALALDCDRQTLLNYEQKEEFFGTIKKAKLRVENYLETKALKGDIVPVMTIFNLKNNFGWKDKNELDVKSSDGSMSPRNFDDFYPDKDE
ncbi:unnamed protein product, partial [marine sediment metagenome]